MFAIGVGANPRWCCSTIGAALLAPGRNSSTNSQIGTDRLPSTTAAGANLTHRLEATAFPISPMMRRASSAPWKSSGTWSLGTRWGGKVAQLVASRRPVGLVGLVLVAPSPPSPTVLDNEQLQILLHAYDSRESIAYTRDHILTTLPLTNAQKERVVEDSLRGAPAARRAWPTQAMLEDIRSDARRINVPTLVLSGERDQVDPTARLREELLPCIPDSQLQILSQVGHLPMLEAPDVVARAIRAFVLNL